MSRTNFENLRVYRLSEDLADAIWDIVIEWNSFARDTVGKQVVRSADSIGANIAEGTGRGSYQDNRRFVRIARGSLHETQHFLRRAFRRKLLTQDQIKQLKPLVDNLAPQLNSYLKSIGAKQTGGGRTAKLLRTTDHGRRTTDDGPRTTDYGPLTTDH